ncbi:MAG: type II toxin-antitoxin system HigB family toxin [Spirochaetales bacterium]|nr:type II toxin-antitoxin system HigB family toxin [Spirochaetales bacterium]
MQVVGRELLSDFQSKHPDSSGALNSWFAEVVNARWQKPTDIKKRYGSVDFLKGNRVIFNICGNKYRLIAIVNYEAGIVLIRFVGTHAEYDKIKAGEI